MNITRLFLVCYIVISVVVIGFIGIRAIYYIAVFFIVPDYYTTENIMDLISSDPLEWIEYPPPYFQIEAASKPFAKWSYSEPNVAHYCANRSRFSWKVYNVDGNARVKLHEQRRAVPYYRDIYYPSPDGTLSPLVPDVDITGTDIPRYGARHILKLSDGWLVGYNHGEFGANTWWFSDDGREKYKISDEHIVEFFIWNDTIFALEGLAHLDCTDGKIITVSQDADNKYEFRVFIELPEAPEASVIHEGELYIVTSDSLIIKVSSNGVASNIVENGFWWSLYPTSIVIDQNRNAFIGMRQGVAMCSLNKQEIELRWLVPSDKYMRQELTKFRRDASRMGHFIDYDLPCYLNRAWRRIFSYFGWDWCLNMYETRPSQ